MVRFASLVALSMAFGCGSSVTTVLDPGAGAGGQAGGGGEGGGGARAEGWLHTWGEEESDVESAGLDVAAKSDGIVYAVGDSGFHGSEGRQFRSVVLSYDASGARRWARAWTTGNSGGGLIPTSARKVAATPTGLYFIGESDGSPAIGRVGDDGSLSWIGRIDGLYGSDYVSSVAAVEGGDAVVAGLFFTPADIVPVLLRVAAEGTVSYARALPFAPAQSFAPQVASAPGGAAYVASNDYYRVVVSRLDPDTGSLEWQRDVSPSALSPGSELALQSLAADDDGVAMVARWKSDADGCGDGQRAVLIRWSDTGALTASQAVRIVPKTDSCVSPAAWSVVTADGGGLTGVGAFFNSGFGSWSVLFALDAQMSFTAIEEPDSALAALLAASHAGGTFFAGIGHFESAPIGWHSAMAFEPVDAEVMVSESAPAVLEDIPLDIAFDLEGEWAELHAVFDEPDPDRRHFVVGRR